LVELAMRLPPAPASTKPCRVWLREAFRSKRGPMRLSVVRRACRLTAEPQAWREVNVGGQVLTSCLPFAPVVAKRRTKQKRKKKGWISWRVLHKQLQSESKDLRVSPGASRALQQQLYAIAEHLVSKVRDRVAKKR